MTAQHQTEMRNQAMAHKVEMKTLADKHNDKLQNIHSNYSSQLAKSYKNCPGNFTINTLTNSVKRLTSLFKIKSRDLKTAQSTIQTLQTQIMTCQTQSVLNQTQLNNTHREIVQKLKGNHKKCLNQIVKVRSNSTQLGQIATNCNNRLNRYIVGGHTLAHNISQLNEQLSSCNEEREHYVGQSLHFKRMVKVHNSSLVSINATCSLYKQLKTVWESKDAACQESLTFCRTQTPVKKKQIKFWMTQHEKANQNFTKCLKSKNEIFNNISSCHQQLLEKNTNLVNLTGSHAELTTKLESTRKAGYAFEEKLLKCQSDFDEALAAGRYLAQINREFEKDIHELRKIINRTTTELISLRNDVHVLSEASIAQKSTITQLLTEERNCAVSKDRTSCLQVTQEKDQLKRQIGLFETVYWANKKELAVCLNSKTAIENKNNTFIQNYYNKHLEKHAEGLILCMKNSTDAFDYTLSDMERLLNITKSAVKVDSKYFTSSNHLDTCTDNLHKCQMSYAKLILLENKSQVTTLATPVTTNKLKINNIPDSRDNEVKSSTKAISNKIK